MLTSVVEEMTELMGFLGTDSSTLPRRKTAWGCIARQNQMYFHMTTIFLWPKAGVLVV